MSTGSYNPVHFMHPRVIELSATYLQEKFGWKVVGGYISPSHDNYVSTKFHGREFIRAVHRLEMCRLATANHPFIAPSSWESDQAGFIDFPYVADAIAQKIKRAFNGHVRLIYVCGTDLASKCGLSLGMFGPFPLDPRPSARTSLGSSTHSHEFNTCAASVWSQEYGRVGVLLFAPCCAQGMI